MHPPVTWPYSVKSVCFLPEIAQTLHSYPHFAQNLSRFPGFDIVNLGMHLCKPFELIPAPPERGPKEFT